MGKVIRFWGWKEDENGNRLPPTPMPKTEEEKIQAAAEELVNYAAKLKSEADK